MFGDCATVSLAAFSFPRSITGLPRRRQWEEVLNRSANAKSEGVHHFEDKLKAYDLLPLKDSPRSGGKARK